MSSRGITKIDQKEYLKKYLSGDKEKKKKKRDKKQRKTDKVRIIDDDINNLENGLQIDEELLLTGDDAPQIVGEYIQEIVSESKIPKWKSFGVKEELVSERASSKYSDKDLWRREQDDRNISNKMARKQSPNNSPPRRKDRNRHSPSCSPTRRQLYLPLSPSRIKKETSTNRRERLKSQDLSPSRKKESMSSPHRNRNSYQSSPRRDRDSVKRDRKRSLNQSPSRKRRSQSPDQSPLRQRGNSPSRERRRSPDQTTFRRRDSDQSPPRKSKDKKSSSNNKDRKSPTTVRRSSPLSHIKRETSLDLSPPRHRKIKRESPPERHPRKHSRWERQEPERSPSPPPTHKHKATKTLEGKKAGLQNAHALHKESLERRKQEDALFEKLSSDISGRNAEIQVRSTGRQGRRAREAKEEDPEERRRKEAHEEKKKQLYDRWGKGLKQIEDYKNRLAEQEHESNKPLARYSNDEDLERHLKEQERADDPMLEYMRQKRKDKEKLSGKPQVPIYQGSFPENRFGIRPGYRWDGVDRSNGYEKKYFDVQNEKRARQDEAYKYSVEDM